MKHFDFKTNLAVDLAKGINAINKQNGKHKAISKMAKMTDLNPENLESAAQKMSVKEKENIISAYSELSRIVNIIER